MSTRIPKLVARYGFKRFLIAGPAVRSRGYGLAQPHAGQRQLPD
jgi:hypothetical protein